MAEYADDNEEETVHVSNLLNTLCKEEPRDKENIINIFLKLIRNHEHHDINYGHPQFIASMQCGFLYITNSDFIAVSSHDTINNTLVILKTFLLAQECNDMVFQKMFESQQHIRHCLRKLIDMQEVHDDENNDDHNIAICKFRSFMLYLCHRIYDTIVSSRPLIKSFLGAVIRRASLVHDDSIKLRSFVTSIVPCLQLCSSIIRGFRLPLSAENKDLALKLIFDLHDIPGKISHVQPLLAVVHQPMLFCIEAFLKHELTFGDTGILSKLVQKITMVWPTGFMGNSPKEILLLQELKVVLQYLGKGKRATFVDKRDDGGKTNNDLQSSSTAITPLKLNAIARSLLFSRFAQSMVSENSNIVRTVLRMWRDEHLIEYFKLHVEQLTSICLRPLITKSIKHWNETVRKHAGLVLSWFIKNNNDGTIRVAKMLFAKEQKEMNGANNSETMEGKVRVDRLKRDNDDGNIILDWITKLIPSDVQSQLNNTQNNSNEESAVVDEGKCSVNGVSSTIQTKSGVSNDDSNNSKTKLKLSIFDLVFGHDLGTGSFATVRYAKRIVRGTSASNWTEEYAIKNISKKYAKVAKREAFVMNRFSNPHLITLISSFESAKQYHLVMEYCKEGDLHTLLSQNGPLSTRSVQFIAGEILSGLNYIHEEGYVYGDLKVENILVHSSGHIRISDFGSTRLVADCVPGEIEGTAIYLAPELLQHKPATIKSDYWSYGCLLFQTLAGRPPGWAVIQDEGEEDNNGTNESKNNNVMDEAVSKKIVSFGNTNKSNSKYPKHFHPYAIELLNGLLEHNCKKRFGYENCVDSNFFDRYIVHNDDGDADRKTATNTALFGDNIDLANLHNEQAPKIIKNQNVPVPEGGLWKRRMFSLVVSNIPTLEKYTENFDVTNLSIINESALEYNKSWIPSGPSFNIFGENDMKKVNENTTTITKPNHPVRGNHGLPTTSRYSGMSTSTRAPLRFPRSGNNSSNRGSIRGAARNNRNNAAREQKKKSGLFYKGIDLTAG